MVVRWLVVVLVDGKMAVDCLDGELYKILIGWSMVSLIGSDGPLVGIDLECVFWLIRDGF